MVITPRIIVLIRGRRYVTCAPGIHATETEEQEVGHAEGQRSDLPGVAGGDVV